MSIRPLIYPVKTLAPIRAALGTNDASVLDRMIEGYKKLHIVDSDNESLKRIRNLGQSFICGDLRGGEEVGEWQEVIHLLARGLGLLETEYPINDDWKWMAWDEYLQLVGRDLPVETRLLLHRLVEGRPLKADGINADASYYAWLEAHEVQQITIDLIHLQQRRPNIIGIVDGFHVELMQWLEICRGKDLLLIAS